MLRDKLDKLVTKYEELSNLIADPQVIEDTKTWQKYVKEHSELMAIVEKYTSLKNTEEELEGARELLEAGDDEMKELAQLEIEELEESLAGLEEDIKILLIPKDPNDDKNVIMELRAGAGGDEAGLFAGELMKMYMRYAEDHRWKAEVIDISETSVGGIKEASIQINGKGAYSRLKFESGTHRVQRVPETESGGRIHTSTATVAVLPEADEVDIEINNNDLKVDVFRSSGNGGQSVNTTDSAVRITHLPTGMVVTCQDGKSQQMNKEQAMRVLRARLYDQMLSEQNAAIAQERKLQIGTGDRSAKIRTYNFPQSRITDHRINMTTHQLDSFLLGDIDEMIDALATNYQAQQLQEG
ncbi:MAG: peptide chain release factor 1 [Tissierellia bacterium]|nr:peptide chain release factor 1 [Tissierellia bacterium]